MRFVQTVSMLALAACAQGLVAQEQPAPPPVRAMTAPPPSPSGYRSEKGAERALADLMRREGMFGVVTADMTSDSRLVLCGVVAESFLATAAGASDPALRLARLGEVWRFEQRLSVPLAEAAGRLGQNGIASARGKAGQAMTLLSLAPDPALQSVVESGEDAMFAFFQNLAGRCDTMLDTMGLAREESAPPPAYIERNTRFRFRGEDYEVVFADTGLLPFAAGMCRGDAPPDLADAPLNQRGTNGMSLLDWAMECEDRATFDALIAAGMDLEAKGLWENPPLVNAASEKRLWYLIRLLDAGAPPDAMGRIDTALREAHTDLDAINHGGNTRAAFDLLRERGASLNFPDFQHSMWFQWGLHDTRWDLILEHWDEFDSDPVSLGDLLEGYLSGDWAWARKRHEGAARKVKALLIAQHGVCFPVGNRMDMEKDARGYATQPDCPKK